MLGSSKLGVRMAPGGVGARSGLEKVKGVLKPSLNYVLTLGTCKP